MDFLKDTVNASSHCVFSDSFISINSKQILTANKQTNKQLVDG